jgi:hypothetical protein
MEQGNLKNVKKNIRINQLSISAAVKKHKIANNSTTTESR